MKIGLLIPLIVAFVGLACTDKKKDPKVLDTSFLNLGKPGEVKHKNKLKLNPNGKILKANQKLVTTSDDGEFKITNFTESLAAGDVIVGSKDNPIVLEVVNVVSQDPTEVIFKAKSASFSELVSEEESSFEFEATPIWNPELEEEVVKPNQESDEVANASKPIKKLNVASDGTVTINNLELFNLQYDKVGEINWSASLLAGKEKKWEFRETHQVKGKGKYAKATIESARFKVTPTFRSNYKFGRKRPQNLKSTFDALMDYSMKIRYEFDENISFDLMRDLFKTKKWPIVIPGTPPVYLTIELDLPLGVRLQTQSRGTVVAEFSGAFSFSGEIVYDKDGKMTPKQKSDFVVKKRSLKLINGNADQFSAEVFIEPRLSTRFYRTLGPYAYLHPYIRGQVDRPIEVGVDDLFLGVNGSLGLQLSEPLFQRTLWSVETPSLFELKKGWDVIGPSKYKIPNYRETELFKEKKNLPVNITELSKERFVLIRLLGEKNPGDLVQYEITEFPKNGILTPAANFASSGEVMYFPVGTTPQQASDSFKFRAIRDGVASPEHVVEIETDMEFIKQNQEPRFSVTSASVESTFTNPNVSKGNVPSFDLNDHWGKLGVAVGSLEPPDGASEIIGRSNFRYTAQKFTSGSTRDESSAATTMFNELIKGFELGDQVRINESVFQSLENNNFKLAASMLIKQAQMQLERMSSGKSENEEEGQQNQEDARSKKRFLEGFLDIMDEIEKKLPAKTKECSVEIDVDFSIDQKLKKMGASDEIKEMLEILRLNNIDVIAYQPRLLICGIEIKGFSRSIFVNNTSYPFEMKDVYAPYWIYWNGYSNGLWQLDDVLLEKTRHNEKYGEGAYRIIHAWIHKINLETNGPRVSILPVNMGSTNTLEVFSSLFKGSAKEFNLERDSKCSTKAYSCFRLEDRNKDSRSGQPNYFGWEAN